MQVLADVLILAGLAAFIGICVLYVFLADRMVSGR